MLKRHHQVYIAVAVIALGLMTLQSRFGPLRPFWFMSSALDSSNSAITYMTDAARSLSRAAVLSEGELMDLRRRNTELRLELEDYHRLRRENARLRAALEFSLRTPHMVAMARVVSKGGAPLANYIVIDKGERHGIRKDMAAIVPEGLVGKVLSVEPGYSRVLLVDDQRFSAAVRAADTRAEGVYSGTGRGRGRLKYSSVEVPLLSNSSLVTSGLDALFPPDITLGTVTSVETLEDELFHRAHVEPVVDLLSLEEVIIVTR